MNGAKHRFALGLTCFFLIGITVVYPFLLYTPNAFVTRWREWYIETAMGTMTHQWLATWFIPENIINEVMTKRYLMNQKQEGIVSNWDGTWEENEEDTAETPKDKFYAMFSELDESEFERFLADNPEYLENGYDEINIDLIGEPSQTHYDTGLKTKQGDTVLAVNAAHGILIVEFAKDLMEKEGKGIIEATLEASRMRLRPILMTSLAMVIGLLPLMFASGVGKNGNQTLGAAAVGGMLIGTICQVFVVPALFAVFQWLQEKLTPMKFEDELNEEIGRASCRERV